MNSYKDLVVWQNAMELATAVHQMTSTLTKPEHAGFDLADRMRHAAIAIPSRIAEGYGRYDRTEYRRCCFAAIDAATELETELILAGEMKLVPEQEISDAEGMLIGVRKLLSRLTFALRSPSPAH